MRLRLLLRAPEITVETSLDFRSYSLEFIVRPETFSELFTVHQVTIHPRAGNGANTGSSRNGVLAVLKIGSETGGLSKPWESLSG